MQKISEREWVEQVVPLLHDKLCEFDPSLIVEAGRRLPYALEVRSYSGDDERHREHGMRYETDLLVSERLDADSWTPRVVVEAKLRSVNTHDAITYSQKAGTHKQVHPYLRYGIFLGDRGGKPLPGRLIRHGAHFDFMLSWQGLAPVGDELNVLIELLLAEIEASRNLETIVFDTRRRGRAAYTVLHRPLNLRQAAAPARPTHHATADGKRSADEVTKYQPLYEYLFARRHMLRVQMMFAEISMVIGAGLPKSAFDHRAWWSNVSNATNRSHAAAWLDAGFLVDSVHQEVESGHVEFVRSTTK
jgi:hypothetical protein